MVETNLDKGDWQLFEQVRAPHGLVVSGRRAGVLTVEVQFGLERRNAADRGVQPGRVEPADPDRHRQLEFVQSPERFMQAVAFDLEEAEGAFDERTVVRVTDAIFRGRRAGLERGLSSEPGDRTPLCPIGWPAPDRSERSCEASCATATSEVSLAR